MPVLRRLHAATVLMAAATVVSVAVLLAEGRNQWFFNDDWGQWSAPTRHGPHIDDYAGFFFNPHNGHWMTLNRVVFELVYRTVGLRSYLPYLIPVIAAHVAAAWILRELCRRAGVGIWLATIGGCVFLWFGAGAEVLVWADAFGFAVPLSLIGAQLLLVDHHGPIDRRDVIGAGLAMLGVMGGGPAITMVAAVALCLALRRRWKPLLVAVAPPAIWWSAWWLWKGHTDSQDLVDRDHISGLPAYVHAGVDNSIEAVTRLGVSAVVLVGLVVLAARLGRRMRNPGLAPVVAMAASALLFFTLLGITRINLGAELASSPRYLYVGGFLLLPMVMVGLDQLTRIDRRLVPAALALVAWAAVSNLFAIDSFARPWGQRKQAIEQVVATVTALPGVEALPPGTRIEDPDGIFESEWVAPVDVLLALRDHGDLPKWGAPSEDDRVKWGSMLLVRALDPAHETVTRCVDAGEEITVDDPTVVVVRSAVDGEIVVQLRSRQTGVAGPERRFAIVGGQDLPLELGVGAVDAQLTAPPGASVCSP